MIRRLSRSTVYGHVSQCCESLRSRSWMSPGISNFSMLNDHCHWYHAFMLYQELLLYIKCCVPHLKSVKFCSVVSCVFPSWTSLI